jgi:hypothetical protein
LTCVSELKSPPALAHRLDPMMGHDTLQRKRGRMGGPFR